MRKWKTGEQIHMETGRGESAGTSSGRMENDSRVYWRKQGRVGGGGGWSRGRNMRASTGTDYDSSLLEGMLYWT